MYQTILIKKGLKSELDTITLHDAELGYTTDTNEIYVGTGIAPSAGGHHLVGSAMTGTLGNRPSAGIEGRFYFDTSADILYVDDGIVWTGISGGGSSAASDITVVPSGGIVSTNVQDALMELDSEITSGGSNVASDITVVPSGGITSTNVQDALMELDSEITSGGGGGSSAASDITVVPSGGVVSTNVQDALMELDSEIESPPGINWEKATGSAGHDWKNITYGNGLFVVIGHKHEIMTSPDGINWTTRNTGLTSRNWESICFGNGLFVACAQLGYIMTSPDGISWTLRSSTTSNSLTGITYGNGMFVIITNTSMALYSYDGITWVQVTSGIGSGSWHDICYGDGKFICIGNSNLCGISTNGTSWNSNTLSHTNDYYGITYGNGLFVAVSDDGGSTKAMTSINGTTWILRTTPGSTSTWYDITYGNGLFVAVAYMGTKRVMTSPDGITWTLRTTAEHNYWCGVDYENGIFIAIGGSWSGTKVAISGKKLENDVKIDNIFHGLSIRGLPSYVDNSAATSGGLDPGDLYINGDILQIVH